MEPPDFQTPPLYLEPESHRYVWLPTMTVLLYSVTGVCSMGKPYTGDPAAGIRGTRIHKALEHFLSGWEQPDWYGLDNWIEPLLAHDYWDDFEPWLCEATLCDLSKSCGGQADILGFDRKRGKVTIVDLKSKASPGTYDVRPQMGAYCEMVRAIHGVEVEECRVMWARPGRFDDNGELLDGGAELGGQSSADECIKEWNKKWGAFQKLKAKGTIHANPTPPAAAPPSELVLQLDG